MDELLVVGNVSVIKNKTEGNFADLKPDTIAKISAKNLDSEKIGSDPGTPVQDEVEDIMENDGECSMSDDDGEMKDNNKSDSKGKVSKPRDELNMGKHDIRKTGDASGHVKGGKHADHEELDYEEAIDGRRKVAGDDVKKKGHGKAVKNELDKEGELDEKEEGEHDDEDEGEVQDDEDCEDGEIKDADDDDLSDLSSGENQNEAPSATTSTTVPSATTSGGPPTERRNFTQNNDMYPRGVCRFFMRGQCTWGVNCRYIHPRGGEHPENFAPPLRDRIMLPPPPGMNMMPPIGLPPREQMIIERPWPMEMALPGPGPELIGPPRPNDLPPPESAWERGLRHAKELMQKASKRKESEPDFEDKRMTLPQEMGEPMMMGNEMEMGKRPVNDPYYDDIFGAPPYEKQHVRNAWRGGNYENFEIQRQLRPPPPYLNPHMERDGRRMANSGNEKYAGREEMMSEPKRFYNKREEVNEEHKREKQMKEEEANKATVFRDRGDDWKDPWNRVKSPKRRHSSSDGESRGRKLAKLHASSATGANSSRSGSRSSSGSSHSSQRSSSKQSSSNSSRSPSLRRKPLTATTGPQNTMRQLMEKGAQGGQQLPPGAKLQQQQMSGDGQKMAGPIQPNLLLPLETNASGVKPVSAGIPARNQPPSLRSGQLQSKDFPGADRKGAHKKGSMSGSSRGNRSSSGSSSGSSRSSSSSVSPGHPARHYRQMTSKESGDKKENLKPNISGSRPVAVDESARIPSATGRPAVGASSVPTSKDQLKNPGHKSGNKPDRQLLEPDLILSSKGADESSNQRLSKLPDNGSHRPEVIAQMRASPSGRHSAAASTTSSSSAQRKKTTTTTTSSRREALLQQLKAVEDAIAKKRSK